MIPAKADPDQQAVFFVDAAHFVLAPFLGFLWAAVRLFIRAPAGRQRFNVLGALNATTHELIAVINDTCITSKEVCERLQKLTGLQVGVPITLFLDTNSRRFRRRPLSEMRLSYRDRRPIAHRAVLFAQLFTESEFDRAVVAVRQKGIAILHVLSKLQPI